MLRLLLRWDSRDAEHVVVEAQDRVSGRPGSSCDETEWDCVVLDDDDWPGDGYPCVSGRQTKGIDSEKAWPIWSFVTRV